MNSKQNIPYQAPKITVVEIEHEALLATSGLNTTNEDMEQENGNW